MSKALSQSKRFWRRFRFQLIYIIAWPFMRLYFPTHVKRDPELKNMKGPMLVISPHQNFLDPFYLAQAIGFRHPPRFVTTDNVITPGIARGFFKWIRAIPIKQFATDITAVREIMRALKNDEIVALFPEGERSLDGRHTRIRKPLLKLMNKGLAPIVYVDINGAYFGWPKWGSGFSRGLVEAKSHVLLTAEEAKKMSLDEIRETITDLMTMNDFRWQFGEDGIDADKVYRNVAPRARYPKRAKVTGLDGYLHLCPACRTPFAMQIRDYKHLVCSHCGTEMYPQDDGSIHIFTGKMLRHADENKTGTKQPKYKALEAVSAAGRRPETVAIDEPLQPERWYVGTLLDWHDRQFKETHKIFANGVEVRSRKRLHNTGSLRDLPEYFIGITKDRRAYAVPAYAAKDRRAQYRILDADEDPFANPDTVALDVLGFVSAPSKRPYVQFVYPVTGERFRFQFDHRAYPVMFTDLIGHMRNE